MSVCWSRMRYKLRGEGERRQRYVTRRKEVKLEWSNCQKNGQEDEARIEVHQK